jgi:hypothetical protein
MFDRNKPYAEIFGNTSARYRQDDKYYDAAGRELTVAPVEKDEVVTQSDQVLPSVAGGDGFDLAGATKDEIINYAYNRYGRKLDARRSLESLRSQVMYLAE